MAELTKINLDQNISDPAPNHIEETTAMPATGTTTQSRSTLIIVIIAVILGLTSGWYAAQRRLLLAGDAPGASTMAQNPDSAGSVKVGDVYGSADEKTFRDSAEGVVVAGGIDGEGTHHLERGADKSQWVYLTSSVVELDNFKGHRVEVWGETFQGKKAGWLMDVGRLKVVELNALPGEAAVTSDE